MVCAVVPVRLPGERPTRPTLVTVTLEDDRPFVAEVPADHVAFAFVHRGLVEIGPEGRSTRVPENTIALLGPGRRVRMRAPDRRSGLLFAAARPIGEPIVQRGPFVMNTDDEIRRAFADYQAGTLDKG